LLIFSIKALTFFLNSAILLEVITASLIPYYIMDLTAFLLYKLKFDEVKIIKNLKINFLYERL